MQLYRVITDFDPQDGVGIAVKSGEVLCVNEVCDSACESSDGDRLVKVEVRGNPHRRGVVPQSHLSLLETEVMSQSEQTPPLLEPTVALSQPPAPTLSVAAQGDEAEADAPTLVGGSAIAAESTQAADSTGKGGSRGLSVVADAQAGVDECASLKGGPVRPGGEGATTVQGTVLPANTTTTTNSGCSTTDAASRAPTQGEDISATAPFQKYPTARLSDVQLRLQQIRGAQRGNTLMSRYLLSNSVECENRTSESPLQSASPGSHPQPSRPRHAGPHQDPPFVHSITGSDAARIRFKNRHILRRKLVLLGYQEVGKTSLRKCFESEPFFFRNLPEVKTTTGVEVHEQRVSVVGGRLELTFSDFAGQESYHSHTHFLTSRCIFGLVWKISAIEQDFQNNGINLREEERLYKWITEVYAKYPLSRIVLIATHLDELRVQGQRSVEMILTKVEKNVIAFLERISAGAPANPVVGNFAVSCKTRQVIGSGQQRHLSGKTISSMLQYLAQVAMDDCMSDREYPGGIIPGRHAKLIEEIERMKKRSPTKLLMPIGELVLLALHLGIDSGSELLQVARLMHSWDIIYLLNPHRIEDNLFIMLHPRWLSVMSASLFSYAHILRTPLHLRSIIGGLQFLVSVAESADMRMMRRGFLRWPLARVLFQRSLSEFLHRVPDDSDYSMCFELLKSMDILYEVEVPCDELSILMVETPAEPEVGLPVISEERVIRYFIPSLAPHAIPSALKRLAPVLFHRGIRLRFEFNFLPDELWWRLQCKLHRHVRPVVVHQPPDAIMEDEEEQLLLDGSRILEADDEHNRWRDAMWLSGQNCRVLVFREGLTTVSVFSAETTPGGSEEVIQSVEDALSGLLVEYEGVRRAMLVACPDPQCDGWLETAVVATHVRVTCPACSVEFSSDAVVPGVRSADSEVVRPFPEPLLSEVGALLSFCLSYRSCLYMCHYLGLPYKGPPPRDERESREASSESAADEVHVEHLHALDKVVQAALFNAWVERMEQQERRKRMLEAEPSMPLPLFR